MGSSGLLLQPHFLFFVEMTFPANQALGQRQEKVRALWNRWFIRSFPDGTDVLWVPPRYQASCQPLGTDTVPALLVLVAQITGAEVGHRRGGWSVRLSGVREGFQKEGFALKNGREVWIEMG